MFWRSSYTLGTRASLQMEVVVHEQLKAALFSHSYPHYDEKLVCLRGLFLT